MKKLPIDWFTRGRLDAEYQQYVVLAYLETVRQNFLADKLCPDLPDLRQHYEAGTQFAEDKEMLNAAFPKRAVGVAGPPPRIAYESEVADDAFMTELDTIMGFALPRFDLLLTEGQQRWTDIVTTLTLAPIGLMPLRPEEGYLLVHNTNGSDTQVFQFSVTLYTEQEPGGRLVYFRFIETVRKSLAVTFESIKLDLIRRHRHLPNPATFILESQRPYPVQETLLPIARKLLAKQVARA